MKKVLFSPVGGTDPISNCRDGALLHICRIYKPDIVYLYLSKEMCEFQKKNNAYRYCLSKLGEMLNHEFEIKTIEKEELIEVQVFDTFIQEFRKILKEIRTKYEDAQILLNVSSGTPAMKSALQILAALAEIPMIPLQVSTPEEGINPHKEDRNHYEPDVEWELNEDNDAATFRNRCIESRNLCLLDEIRKETVIKQIKSYNYVAALSIAEEMTNQMSEKTMALLHAACWRLKLNIFGINNELKWLGISILPVKEQKRREIFEYILNLEIKMKKEEYADFLRAITPIVVELFKIGLKQYTGINWKELCIERQEKQRVSKENIERWYWDTDKLNKRKEIKKVLDKRFGGQFKENNIYSIHLLTLIEAFAKNNNIITLSKKINSIEQNVRNMTAHNLVSVTENWVKKNCGFTPKEIMQLIKDYVKELDLGIKKEDWNSYDMMNQKIIDSIKRG